MKLQPCAVGALMVGMVIGVWAPSAHALGPVTGDISGYVPTVVLGGNEAVRLLPGADVAFIYAYDQSRVDVLAGDLSFLHLHDHSTANISGGDISWLYVKDSSRVDLTNAGQLSWLILSGQGDAHLYGTNFRYSRGHLDGQWANGAAFSFWAFFNDDPSNPPELTDVVPAGLHLHVIPEPCAATLAASAWCLAAVGRRVRNKRRELPIGAASANLP